MSAIDREIAREMEEYENRMSANTCLLAIADIMGEAQIMCEDLRMMTLQTERLFNAASAPRTDSRADNRSDSKHARARKKSQDRR